MTPTLSLASAAASNSGAAILFSFLPWIAIFGIFYFLMIRPQNLRMKAHQASIAAVKKGDRVVTGGGLVGKVVKVGENEVEVELGQGVKVTAIKATLSQVIDPTAAKPAND